MNQNFYIPDEKKELLNKAQELSDKDSLSAAIVEALEVYVERKSTLTKDVEKQILEVPVGSREAQGHNVVKFETLKFLGRLLNQAKVEIDDKPDPRALSTYRFELYQGKQGKFLLYWLFGGNEGDYVIADSLEELKNEEKIPELPEGFIEEAKQKLRKLEQGEAVAEIVDI